MARKLKLGAGYRQRKDGRIEYRWTGEDGKRYSVAGRTVEECKEKEEQKKKDIARAAYTSNANITLAAYFEEWQQSRDGVVKVSSIKKDKSLFTLISPALGAVKVCKLEKRQIQRLQDSLKEKDYTTNYINAVMKLLSCLLKAAVEDGIIDRNPASGIKNLKMTGTPARETIHRALTVEETTAFFKAAAARNSWFYDLYEFLINTGCRIGEAGALQRSDVDFKNNVIHIRRTITAAETGAEIGDSPKTKTSKRDIPMNAAIKAALQRQEQRNREMFGESIISMNDRYFKAIRGGLISSAELTRDIAATLKDTGIDYFTPHAFRDTFATRAIEAGMNPQTLKVILGHSSYSMTMDLYAHVMENTKQKEMDLIQIKTGT